MGEGRKVSGPHGLVVLPEEVVDQEVQGEVQLVVVETRQDRIRVAVLGCWRLVQGLHSWLP